MINSRVRQSTWLVGIALFMLTCGAWAGAERQSFRATLVWGTNTSAPAGSNLEPVSPEVALKLGKLPFKWSHYYLVEKKEFQVATGHSETVRMSEHCEITVRPIDDTKVELQLRGEGRPVGRVKQNLPDDEMLVTGGNAENYTAWFVVLRRANDQ